MRCFSAPARPLPPPNYNTHIYIHVGVSLARTTRTSLSPSRRHLYIYRYTFQPVSCRAFQSQVYNAFSSERMITRHRREIRKCRGRTGFYGNPPRLLRNISEHATPVASCAHSTGIQQPGTCVLSMHCKKRSINLSLIYLYQWCNAFSTGGGGRWWTAASPLSLPLSSFSLAVYYLSLSRFLAARA